MDLNRTPKIRAKNYEAIYDYYCERDLHENFAKVNSKVTAALYHPTATYAEGLKDYLETLKDKKTPLIIIANHLKTVDQYGILAAMMSSALGEMVVGNTIIWAKAEYWYRPHTRLRMNLSDAVPTFRPNIDKKSNPLKAESKKLLIRSLDIAKPLIGETAIPSMLNSKQITPMQAGRGGKSLAGMTVYRMANKGNNVFGFVEGTRNDVDPYKILPIKPGIGSVALQAWGMEELVDVPMLPIGIGYADNSIKSKLTPSVYFNQPILSSQIDSGSLKDRTNSINELMAVTLQHSLDQAYEHMPQ